MSQTFQERLGNLIVQTVPLSDRDQPQKIYAAYAEHWRVYHGARHVVHMFNLLDQLYQPWMNRRAIELMILYHDVWYKVGREPGLNERMSAEWATRDIEQFAPDLVDLVSQGILATEKHELDGVQDADDYKHNVAVFLSLDLWGLGQDWQGFVNDTKAIWAEYMPIATREEFNRGRAAWAQEFLERSHIYPGQTFANREEVARANLQRLANM